MTNPKAWRPRQVCENVVGSNNKCPAPSKIAHLNALGDSDSTPHRTSPKKLVWHRGKIAVAFVQDGKRRRVSLGTADPAEARMLMRKVGPGKRKPARQGQFVYFCQIETPDQFIKIGFATNIGVRMSNMRVSLPYGLKVLAVIDGTPADEKAIQKRFAAHRVRGEWFRPDPALLAYIEDWRVMGLGSSSASSTDTASFPHTLQGVDGLERH